LNIYNNNNNNNNHNNIQQQQQQLHQSLFTTLSAIFATTSHFIHNQHQTKQFNLDLVVSGDVRVTVLSAEKKLFQFWFNTAMLPLDDATLRRYPLQLGKVRQFCQISLIFVICFYVSFGLACA
jgi:hypothetical protein